MRNFKGYIKTNKLGSLVEFEFEVDDEDSDEEIERVFLETRNDWFESWYEKIEGN